MARTALGFLLLMLCARAIEISRLETGLAASAGACNLTRPAATADAREPQVLVKFTVRGAGPQDAVRVEWVDPSGEVAEAADYTGLPAGRAVCVIHALQVGGFAPATRPGRWRVRVLVRGQPVREREFAITGRAAPLSVRVAEAGPEGLVLEAWGAEPDTTINVARYREDGQWEYVAVLLASRREGNRLWADPGPLPPGEYLVVLRNPDGSESLPSRFVVAAAERYRKPYPEGEIWRVSQGPYGGFSHFGRALHAWDFAPVAGGRVAAMRGGVVLARDLRLGQTPDQRLFGNYITIRHDDGTHAHYAHLKSGTFRVRTGQRVEAGEILAEAGNSGYSFGRHVHVHLTRSPSITAPSVPLRFDEAPGVPVMTAAPRPAAEAWQGSANFAQWWSRLLQVPRKARRLAVRLAWNEPEAELALYLVKPTGEWIRAEGCELVIPHPEPGLWRVSVQSVRGDASFLVHPEITLARP